MITNKAHEVHSCFICTTDRSARYNLSVAVFNTILLQCKAGIVYINPTCQTKN